MLELQNPHSVQAVLATRPSDVLGITLFSSRPSHPWAPVLAQAQRHGIAIQESAATRRSERRRTGEPKHGRQACVASATVRPKQEVSLERLFGLAAESGASCKVYLALDHIQDPRNVGAILRSAAFFGVEGVVLTRHRSAPLTATVYDVAAGGVEYVPFSIQPNLAAAIRHAKQVGVWVLGTSEHSDRDVTELDCDRNWLLILGSEEKGMQRLSTERCDVVCRLKPLGQVGSLNVSVAAAVFLSVLTGKRKG